MTTKKLSTLKVQEFISSLQATSLLNMKAQADQAVLTLVNNPSKTTMW
ncbi:hypothetical protein O9992_13055 [Vibrio lentus]|nr:hypothetical protein [Vibrio lentus]